MQITDLLVEVRDRNLNRIGQLLPSELVGLTLVLRYNSVGTWQASLPVGNRLAEELRKPGSGIVVTTDQGTLFSGPMTAVKTNQSTDDLIGTYEFSGVDDSVFLTERLAYPTPSTMDVTQQSQATDDRTGFAEDVIKGYITANIGPDAPVGRRVTNLVVEPSQGRGSQVTAAARFETLQELIAGLADVSGLGYTITQVDNDLVFRVFEPEDRSSYIRLDLQNGQLTRSEYSLSQPKATTIIVGGQGEAEERILIERSNAEAELAEDLWGRRIEVFTDQRTTTELAQLEQAADEILVNDGKSIVGVSISPSDDTSMLFGVDWNLGDKVTCVIGDVEIQSVVTEVGIAVSDDGVRVGATVGEPRDLDYETQILVRQANQALRISKLERT